MPIPTRNDFKKAMSSIVLTAGAALAEAQRVMNKAGAFNRRKSALAHSLTMDFCRLLIAPVSEFGPGFTHIPGFAETYCRKHLAAVGMTM